MGSDGMRKLILFLLTAMLLVGCGEANQNNQEAVYMNITAEEAKAIMETEEGYVILDTRTREEYDQGHIPRCHRDLPRRDHGKG